VLGPHVRRQEVDKRCLENVFLRFLALVSLKDLVVTMVATAESLKATWTTPLRRMGTKAGNLLTRLPGFGDYGQAKVMRIVIHWYLHRNKCTFPPGDGEWFNWDTMSGVMTEELEAI
jgi:hypothetical protein